MGEVESLSTGTYLGKTGAEYVEEQCVVDNDGDEGKIAIFEYGEPATAVISDTFTEIEEMR